MIAISQQELASTNSGRPSHAVADEGISGDYYSGEFQSKILSQPTVFTHFQDI